MSAPTPDPAHGGPPPDRADLHVYVDPVCPSAWMTSTWVREVARQRGYRVDWRFFSLRLLNASVDYDAQLPPEYEAGHTAGLRLLRVAARVRREHGRPAVADLYASVGARVFESAPLPVPRPGEQDVRGTAPFVAPVLAGLGLPADLVTALDDDGWDEELRAETEEALRLAGRDVGTPVLHVDPPEGLAFFGPVISRQPSPEQAAELWDHVLGLARFPGFAELKRGLRELPRLPALGVPHDEPGAVEDWHGGSRRQHR